MKIAAIIGTLVAATISASAAPTESIQCSLTSGKYSEGLLVAGKGENATRLVGRLQFNKEKFLSAITEAEPRAVKFRFYECKAGSKLEGSHGNKVVGQLRAGGGDDYKRCVTVAENAVMIEDCSTKAGSSGKEAAKQWMELDKNTGYVRYVGKKGEPARGSVVFAPSGSKDVLKLVTEKEKNDGPLRIEVNFDDPTMMRPDEMECKKSKVKLAHGYLGIGEGKKWKPLVTVHEKDSKERLAKKSQEHSDATEVQFYSCDTGRSDLSGGRSGNTDTGQLRVGGPDEYKKCVTVRSGKVSVEECVSKVGRTKEEQDKAAAQWMTLFSKSGEVMYMGRPFKEDALKACQIDQETGELKRMVDEGEKNDGKLVIQKEM